MDLLNEAINLVRRYEKGDAFRGHVRDRLNLVVPVVVLCAVVSLCLGLGLLGTIDHAGFGAFLAIAALPIVLIGSALLQLYLFFSWLELRALRPMLARGSLGKAPPIPWIPVALLLVLPFVLLALASLKTAAVVLLLAIATPFAYAHFDNSGQRP